MDIYKIVIRSFLISLLLIFGQAVQAIEITSSFSGSFYDQAVPGQGFSFEVIDGNPKKVLVYFYSFDTQGDKLWLFGTGDINGNESTVDLYEVDGGVFGEEFDANEITVDVAGTLDLQFLDCNTAEATLEYLDSTSPLKLGIIGTGFTLSRLTSIKSTQCTGGISDDVPASDNIDTFQVFFTDTKGETLGTRNRAIFEQRADRSEFLVKVEKSLVGNSDFTLHVGGIQRASVDVSELKGEDQYAVLFTSPVRNVSQLLDFDPRGALIEIKQNNMVLMQLVMDGVNSLTDGGSDAPEFGNSETRLLYQQTIDFDTDISVDTELRQMEDFVEFRLELFGKDLEAGHYDVLVNEESVGVIEVVTVNDGIDTFGEVKFRYPVESGKQLLSFDPRGSVISISAPKGMIGGDTSIIEFEFSEGESRRNRR